MNIAPPPPSEIQENLKENSRYKLFLIGRGYYRYWEKSRQLDPPAIVFFAAEVPWFNQGTYWVVKPLIGVFLWFKGPRSFKKK